MTVTRMIIMADDPADYPAGTVPVTTGRLALTAIMMMVGPKMSQPDSETGCSGLSQSRSESESVPVGRHHDSDDLRLESP